MLESWNISQEHAHLVTSDTHSLQLVVKEELLSQRAITDITDICKQYSMSFSPFVCYIT